MQNKRRPNIQGDQILAAENSDNNNVSKKKTDEALWLGIKQKVDNVALSGSW